MGKYKDDVFGSIIAAQKVLEELFEKSGINIEKNREKLLKNEELMTRFNEYNAEIVEKLMDGYDLKQIIDFELLEKNKVEFEKTVPGIFMNEVRMYLNK